MKTNVLYYGDNLQVLREKIPDESVDLIYIDPPFSSARNYFVIFKDRTGKASAAQQEAFSDTWDWGEEAEVTYRELQRSYHHELAQAIEALRTILKESPMMAYLVAMAIRLIELRRILKSTGSLYLHCDPTASHYLKILLDTIFGPENFRNEIIWKRTTAKSLMTKRLSTNHDTILAYQKSAGAKWNADTMFLPYDESHLDEKTLAKYGQKDADGRRFTLGDLTNPNHDRPNLTYEFLGHTKVWRWTRERMEAAYTAGLVVQATPGSVPRIKRFLDEQRGKPIDDVWVDLPPINSQSAERLGYPTQKPLALLRRIIEASSDPGDVVLDAFCGCGTAVHAAHQLGRQWIGIDITPVAVAVQKSRLEDAFPELRGKVEVDGFPLDLEGAKTLFESDPHRFQIWACTLIGAFPLTKKGADQGIDGWMAFTDFDEVHHRGVVQVKGGKASVAHVRDFGHVITREKATIGFFLCMGEVTKPMRDEAIKMGIWESSGGNDYPRCQILNVGALLSGQARPRFPLQEKKSMLGYKASKGEKNSDKNLKLFDV